MSARIKALVIGATLLGSLLAAAPAWAVMLPALQLISTPEAASTPATARLNTTGSAACASAVSTSNRIGDRRTTPIRWSLAAWTRCRRPHD